MTSETRDLGTEMAQFSHLMRQQPTPENADDDDDDEERELQQQKSEPYECTCRAETSQQPEGLRNRYRRDVEEEERNISIPASSEHAEKMTVMPFLAQHIAMQYNAAGAVPTAEKEGQERTDTRFCSRHRPDLKCRRQVDEPSMEQLQNELATLSQSDQQAISHVWSLFSAAPAKHRDLMLQGILTQCCFPQLSQISASVRDLIKMDFLAALPAELGFKILCYLDTTSLCQASQVSQRWRSLADDDVVWHRMCEQHIDRKCTKCGIGLPLLERMRLRIEKRQIQLRATGRGLNEWSPRITPIPEELPRSTSEAPVYLAPPTSGTKRPLDEDASSPESTKRHCTTSLLEDAAFPTPKHTSASQLKPRKRPWKDVYKDRYKVGTNWKYGRFSTKVFRGHTNGVMCLQFDDNVLISGSYDSTVKVWDVNTGEELRTLKGHTSGIRCLQFNDTKLMTGSLDSTLRLWNWRTGQCLRTFHAHTGGIVTLHFSGPWTVSGSMDHTIRVWNSDTSQTFLLRGHTDWVNCVKLDAASRTLFSASDDLTVRLWDLDAKECIRVFEGHVGQIQQVVPLPAEFELDDPNTRSSDKDDDASSVGSAPTTHHFPEYKRDTPEFEDPFWPDDPSRPAPPRYMLTGGLDSTIRLWDVHFNPHKHPVEATTTTNGPNNLPPNDPSPATFKILPTDPRTNSHTPRAQACVRTFFGHVEGIWALAADHLRLISGSEDRMMKVWDPRTGKCERTFSGHAGPVTCVWLSDSRVASGGEDCEVRMLCFGE